MMACRVKLVKMERTEMPTMDLRLRQNDIPKKRNKRTIKRMHEKGAKNTGGYSMNLDMLDISYCF